MKNVKKLFAALLVTAMALSTLTACGSKTETPSADASTDSDNSAATTTVDYPTKDITVVVPYGAGGTTDLSGRRQPVCQCQVRRLHHRCAELRPGAQQRAGQH